MLHKLGRTELLAVIERLTQNRKPYILLQFHLLWLDKNTAEV